MADAATRAAALLQRQERHVKEGREIARTSRITFDKVRRLYEIANNRSYFPAGDTDPFLDTDLNQWFDAADLTNTVRTYQNLIEFVDGSATIENTDWADNLYRVVDLPNNRAVLEVEPSATPRLSERQRFSFAAVECNRDLIFLFGRFSDLDFDYRRNGYRELGSDPLPEMPNLIEFPISDYHRWVVQTVRGFIDFARGITDVDPPPAFLTGRNHVLNSTVIAEL